MFPHLHQQSVHFVVNLDQRSALRGAHRRRLVRARPCLFGRLVRLHWLFALQGALDEIANLVVFRAGAHRQMSPQDAASVGVNHEDFVTARIQQDRVRRLRPYSVLGEQFRA